MNYDFCLGRRTACVSFWAFLLAAVTLAQTEPHPRPIRLPTPQDGLYEGEFHLHRSGTSRVQGMRGFGTEWSRDHHLLWDGLPEEVCKLQFNVRHASRYQLILRCTTAPDYGRFAVRLDGKLLDHEIDLYTPGVELAPPQTLGEFKLSAGIHAINFQLLGANPKASFFREDRYLLGLDYLKLVDLDPDHTTEIKSAVPRWQSSTFKDIQPLLAKHCYRCHGDDVTEGELNLAQLSSKSELVSDLDRLSKIATAIALGEMPPEDEPPLPVEHRQQISFLLKDWLDESLQANTRLANIVMRRLNRYEYNNAVRDLLNLKGDIYPLPERVIRAELPYYDPISGFFPDAVLVGNRTLGKFQVERQILTGVVPFAIDLQAEHGFNNRGQELSISPLLLETFVKLGRSIVSSPEFNAYCQDYAEVFAAPADLDKKTPAESGANAETFAHPRLQNLLSRAFRAPIDHETLHRYLRYFGHEYRKTSSFSQAMKATVAGMLASPRFLYLVEKTPQKQQPTLLSDYELAARLAMFLWSSLPDKELLDTAATGKLHDPEILHTQIRRMLWDRRSQALSENFARQWLRLDQLITAIPDKQRFPTYYSRIGCEYWKFGLQMMIEPLLLFESVLVEDLSIQQLIDSDYSYRSDELQTWYSSPAPFAEKGENGRFNTGQQDFRRRALNSPREGGVITTAAVMTMTSSPLRTSPITRGSWVLSVIFNRPPDPPPDTVPEIEADDDEIEALGLTLRERLKQHQTNASCAACHAKIDPLGFVLENYDAVGRWRDTYRSGLKIDSSGTLFGETEFTDIASFKAALQSRPEVFTRAFSEHLLAYALGRKLQVTDKPAIDKMVRRTLAQDGRFSALIVEIAMSHPFLHKASQPADQDLPDSPPSDVLEK